MDHIAPSRVNRDRAVDEAIKRHDIVARARAAAPAAVQPEVLRRVDPRREIL